MTRQRRRLGLLTAAATVLVGGCGGNAAPEADRLDLAAMDQYGCRFGFWLGSPDGEVAVWLAATNEMATEGELPKETTLPDDTWDATVLIGEDLYANWCDDVLEPSEPEPAVAEQWPITAGTITLHEPAPAHVCPHGARATATGLEATRPDDTTVELGERELTNEARGCFAG